MTECRKSSVTLLDQNIVDEISLDKNVCGAGNGSHTDMCVGKDAPQLVQGGQTHHRIANPVGRADDDALDLI